MPFPYSTFSEHLDALAARQPDAPLLIDQDLPVSAEALRARSRALAAGLARIGVRPGHRVAVWLPNCAAWVESFLACAHLGALVLAVNTRFRALEVADILGRGQADWLVFWPGFKGIDFQGILDGVAARRDRAGRGRRIPLCQRQPGTPLRGPAGLARPRAPGARQCRRAVLHHVGNHVQAQIRAA
jgi:hypothetical protein